MKPWLSYSFADPSESLPEYHSHIDPLAPCFFWWRPAIFCDELTIARGVFYQDRPLPDCNAVEIHVESIRAYHLLSRRKDLHDWKGLVRILPPKPEKPDRAESAFNVSVFGYDRNELMMGAHIVDLLGGGISKYDSMMPSLMKCSNTVVFPAKQEATALFLCAAISAACNIVSSDAGAAEEYLSAHAVPGTWHVVHKHDQGLYAAAVNDLLGKPSGINRSMYLDEAPYE